MRCYMGDLFVYVSDLFLDPEAQILEHGHWATPTGYTLVGINQDPEDCKESPLYAPGTQVLIKV